MIIGIVNQKGGTGKTTLAINLADAIARKSRRVLLVDADPQESVCNWYAVNQTAHCDVRSVGDEDIADIAQKEWFRYDDIIIDAPPAVDETTESILNVSDLAIVPIGPSPLDIWSSKDIIALIRRILSKRTDFSVRLVICKTIVGTRLSKEARTTLQGFGFDLFESQISQRVAFIESMIAGLSVLDYAPDSAAAREISSLRNEIFPQTK